MKTKNGGVKETRLQGRGGKALTSVSPTASGLKWKWEEGIRVILTVSFTLGGRAQQAETVEQKEWYSAGSVSGEKGETFEGVSSWPRLLVCTACVKLLEIGKPWNRPAFPSSSGQAEQCKPLSVGLYILQLPLHLSTGVLLSFLLASFLVYAVLSLPLTLKGILRRAHIHRKKRKKNTFSPSSRLLGFAASGIFSVWNLYAASDPPFPSVFCEWWYFCCCVDDLMVERQHLQPLWHHTLWWQVEAVCSTSAVFMISSCWTAVYWFLSRSHGRLIYWRLTTGGRLPPFFSCSTDRSSAEKSLKSPIFCWSSYCSQTCSVFSFKRTFGSPALISHALELDRMIKNRNGVTGCAWRS